MTDKDVHKKLSLNHIKAIMDSLTATEWSKIDDIVFS
jgi:hypothetical protein